MSEIKEICKVYSYTSKASGPCGCDGCTIVQEECGINLEGLPKNVQTERLFEIASDSGSPLILSFTDVWDTEMYNLVNKERKLSYKESFKATNRFLEDAWSLIEKIRASQKLKEPKVPSAPKLQP